MDVKIAFLNGVVEEEIYIEYPEGFGHIIWSHMCPNSGENCMVSNKHPEHGTLGSTIISLDWASPKVKQM